MPLNLFIRTMILVLLAALGGPAVARETNIWSDPSQVHFESLTLADGLYDSTVFSIAQDGTGQIWFGTASGGANCYDGYRVHAFLHDPAIPGSLSHSAAGEVIAARDGTVLVGTWGGGINRYTGVDGAFEQLNPGQAPTQIQIMFEDSQQRIWVGSADDGLHVLNTPQGSLQPVLLPDGQPFSRVWSLAEDDQGGLWVATDDGLVNLNGETLEPANGWQGHPRALMHDGKNLWVGDTANVYRHVDGALQPMLEDSQLVNTLALSPSGQVLVGTLAGIIALDSNGQQVPPFGRADTVLFPDRNIRRFFFDSSGVGWIATREAGLIRALPAASGFDGFKLDSSLDTADTLLELAPDDLLIGSRRGMRRLQKVDGEIQYRNIPAADSLSINRLTRDRDGVLVGTYKGAILFDPTTEQFRSDPRFSVLENIGVTSLHSWGDGRVDMGTWSVGLYRFDADGQHRHYVRGGENAIPDVSISDIEADPDGGIWLGMWNAGIAYIDAKGSVTTVDRSKLGIEGNVHDLLFDEGMLWVGTSFGLARFDPQTQSSERIILIPEFPNTSVQRLAHGPDRLWASTTRGVIAVDHDTQTISRYGTTDGLVVEEFFARSGDVGEEGRMYFGGLGGLVSFLPGRVASSASPPTASIVGAWVDGAAVAVSNPIVLPPGAGTLRLRHVVADYRSPQANRFRTRLTGRDDQWSLATADPESILTGLTPGDYRFELQAANANGLWNETAASVSIQVLPAWWQTHWGRLSIVAGLSLMIYLWHYWNTARIRARNRVLSQEVDRQTQALREANKSLAQAASTDHLTGLLNRRGFLARVETITQDGPRWFTILDVDNFKQFNDRYGHDIGDQVLTHVAGILQQSSPSGSHVARWGGEEFIIHFEGLDSAAAIKAVEIVRTAVEREQLEMTPAIPSISVTAGLARMTPDETCMSAINRADARLMRGKADGKNRLVATGEGMVNRRG